MIDQLNAVLVGVLGTAGSGGLRVCDAVEASWWSPTVGEPVADFVRFFTNL